LVGAVHTAWQIGAAGASTVWVDIVLLRYAFGADIFSLAFYTVTIECRTW
jgi:hypothetical protein